MRSSVFLALNSGAFKQIDAVLAKLLWPLFSYFLDRFSPTKLRSFHYVFSLPLCQYELYKRSFVLRIVFDEAY